MHDSDFDWPDRHVCIIGLGYVGLTLAVAMAEAGYLVSGVEINERFVGTIREGRAHFYEPGLDERLKVVVASGRLRAATTLPDEPRISVYIITVGTPLDAEGRARLDMVQRVTHQVAERVKDGDGVILRSTVKLGTTRNVVMPILAATGRDVDVGFCPERTLEGRALEELAHLPQIVGAATPRAARRFSQLFNLITPTVIQVRDPETAEMIKLIDNTYRDVSFAFANEVARLCNAAGISAAEVIRFGKLGYPRTNLPMPGPVGGPCLSKDPHILMESVAPWGVEPAITRAARATNEGLMDEVAAFLAAALDRDRVAKVSVLGLAFKGQPETNDLRGTTAVALIAALRARFPRAEIHGFDHVVDPREIAGLGLRPAASLQAAFEEASLVVVHNNHAGFALMPLAALSGRMQAPGIIYDFWNNYQPGKLKLAAGIRYVGLGGHRIGG